VETGAAEAERDPGGTADPGEGRFIGFGYVPVTAEAKAAVAELVGMVLDHEQATGERDRARGEGRLGVLRDATGRFVADLALGVDEGELLPQPCPKNRNEFGPRYPLAYRPFIAAHDAFRDRRPSLIEEVTKGVRQPAGGGKWQGRVGTVRPTPVLVGLLRRHGIAEGTAFRHFRWDGKAPPLMLRTASEWCGLEKVQGRPMRVAVTEQTRELTAEVVELNASAKAKVVGVEFAGWSRIFGEGDREGFAWDRGGRLYAHPGGSYQRLPAADRQTLTIDGGPVAEVDIRASHLTLAYACLGHSLKRHAAQHGYEDPYAIRGVPRGVVKGWMVAALTLGKHPGKWPRKQLESDPELAGYSIGDVTRAVLELHPILDDLGSLSWGKLQFLESLVVIGAMKRLNGDGIPALPVHDSLIVPRDAYWLASLALHQGACKHWGVELLQPKVTPLLETLPPPHEGQYKRLVRDESLARY
jgi:hypothetical protein